MNRHVERTKFQRELDNVVRAPTQTQRFWVWVSRNYPVNLLGEGGGGMAPPKFLTPFARLLNCIYIFGQFMLFVPQTHTLYFCT